MFWKGLLVIFCATFVPSYGAIICHYEDINDIYTCNMLIFNPDGTQNTSILGNHLQGRNNDDVVHVIGGGATLNIPQTICSTFPNLEKMELENLGISSLSNNPVVSCNKLKMLSLKNNGINSLAPSLFQNTVLEELYLDENSFSTINSGVLGYLDHLTKLSLKGNVDITITGQAFERLINLKHLDLSNCNLNTLNSEWFENGLAQLEVLNLADNPLTEVPANVFDELIELEVLALDFNNISSLNENSFKLPELKALFLDSNNLVNIPENVFGYLENLEILYLSQNNFSSGLPENIFKNLTSLTTLGMHDCSLKDIKREWFQSLSALSILLLEENQIEEFPDRTFSSLNNLKLLSLVNNSIELLSSRSFGSVSQLSHLDVRENQIKGIEHHLMNQAKGMKVALFSGNECANFSTLNYTFTADMDRLNECFDGFDSTPFVLVTNNSPDFEWYNIRVNDGWKFINLVINASESAHIGLTNSTTNPTPLLEIRLGEKDNTELHIIEGDHITSIPFTDLRDKTEPLPFKIELGFMITLYKKNEARPFFGYFIRTEFDPDFFGLRTQIPPVESKKEVPWDVLRSKA